MLSAVNVDFLRGQMLYTSLKIATLRRKHSLDCEPPMCLDITRNLLTRLRENVVYSSRNPEALTEISIHDLTDETKLAVGG